MREQVAAIDIPCYFSQNLEVRILVKITGVVNGSYMFAGRYCFATPLKLFYGAHASILINQNPYYRQASYPGLAARLILPQGCQWYCFTDENGTPIAKVLFCSLRKKTEPKQCPLETVLKNGVLCHASHIHCFPNLNTCQLVGYV